MNVDTLIALGLKLMMVLGLVLLNGFFVAAEFALVKIRSTQLEPMAKAGHKRARMVRRLLGNLDASLSAAQLGITLSSLGLGWVGEPVFFALLQPGMDWLGMESQELRHALAFVVGFSALTFLHIVAGEQAPKILAIQKALPTSLWVAYPLRWFFVLFYPINWVLNSASRWLLRRLGLESVNESERLHSEEELRLLFATSRQPSELTGLGHNIVLNAMDLRQRVVRDVMRPRQEIVSLNTSASMTECLDVAEKSRFSRYPLCEGGNLDLTVGVVHLKDLYAMRLKARSGAELAPVARKIVYVPETAHLERLLQRFLDRKLHLAIVIDEYGGTVGLVTLENILEELVGQIQDEFDQEKPLLTRVGEHTWEVLGTLPVHEMEELVGQSVAEEGVTTVSGWVTHKLGGFPKEGDTLRLGDFELRVEEVEETRVARLLLKKIPAETAKA
jgi:CBS domain containing-hemolysin-like protein